MSLMGSCFFTRDHMQGNFVTKDLKLPQAKPAPRPQAKTSSKASSSAEHLHLFRIYCIIAIRVSKPNICRLLMLHCL